VTDEQFKAFLNTVMNGFNETIQAVSKNSADHDLLIRMDEKLDMHMKSIKSNRVLVTQHIAESIPVRDAINTANTHILKCQNEKRGDNLKECVSFMGGARKALWVVYVSIIGIIIKMIALK